MGERDLTSRRPPRPRREPAAVAGWALLLALLAILILMAAAVADGLRDWRLGSVALLALAAVVCARVLERRLGGSAPLWVVVWLFGSVVFAQVFWDPRTAVLVALSALAWALVYGGRGDAGEAAVPGGELPEVWPGGVEDGTTRLAARWVPAGALLGVLGAAHPFYLVLLAPAALAIPARRAAAARTWLAAGAALGFAAAWLAGGFPEAGLAAALRDARWHRSLLTWNLAYFFAGRYSGVLVYCLPLVLGAFAADSRRGRWSLPLAVAAGSAAFLVLEPFGIAGQSATLGNPRFLPLYPALWFLAARRARIAPALLVAALAALALHGLWRWPVPAPGAEALAPLARRWLPVETTRRALPGAVDVTHRGLELRLLDGHVAAQGERLRLRSGVEADLLVTSPAPLASMVAEFDPQAASSLEAQGAAVEEILFRPDGRVAFELRPEPARRHPSWRGREPVHVYSLTLRLPGARAEAVGFTLVPGGRLRPGGGGE